MASEPRINDDNANVTLVCGTKETVKAHATVLKCCKYFAKKFRSNKINDNNKDMTLELQPEVDYDDLLLFVNSLYGDIVITEENWSSYNELCTLFEYDGSIDSDSGDAIEDEEGASGDNASVSESADGDDNTSKDESELEDDDSEMNANGVLVSTDCDEKPKILVFKELLNELKPSTLQSVFNRIPTFDIAAKDVVIDLMLTEFIRSRNIQVRMAHFQLYDKLQSESKYLFENVELDIKTLLVPKVEYLFAQQVLGRCEDEVPNVTANGGPLLPLDEQVGRFLQQMRRDVRAHARAIISLFGEFYLRNWIGDRSVDLVISALLQIATNEKLEYFCQLIALIEKRMQEKLKASNESIRLDNYEAQIKEAFSKASPKVKQIWYKDRNTIKYKMNQYGVDQQAKSEPDNVILDHIYWIRSNIASLNADQYYKQSGGFAVRGLNTPVINYTIEDLKPIVHESTAAPRASDNRVKRVPRGDFFRKMRAMREKQARDILPNQTNASPTNKSNPSENTINGSAKENSSKSSRPGRRRRREIKEPTK